MENQISYSAMQFKTDLFSTPINNSSDFFNLSTNVTISLKKDWKIQAWSWYQSPLTWGLFELKSQSGTGFGFSKSFFNKQLNLNLSFFDIFRKNGTRAYINFQNQKVYANIIPESPQFFFTARYNFGNTKAARRSEFESGADDLKDRAGK
jgi:iron complex outermembrane recepter protein